MAVQDWQALEGGRPYIWDALRFLWEAGNRMSLIPVHNRVMLKFWYNTDSVWGGQCCFPESAGLFGVTHSGMGVITAVNWVMQVQERRTPSEPHRLFQEIK